MTTPHGSAPDGAWQYASGFGQGISEEDALALATGGTKKTLEDTVHDWDGMIIELDDLAEQVEDIQLELGERVDLLDGVRGYCSLYLGSNWLVPGNAEKRLPFNSQLGPNKGAVPYDGVGIKFLEKGLWRSDVHVSFQVQSGWFTSAALASVYLTVRPISAPTTIYTRRQFSLVVGHAGDETCSFSNTFVIPDDDAYFVTVELIHRNTRQNVFGGTLRSALSVNKWDFRIDNAVVAPTVPDGGTL